MIMAKRMVCTVCVRLQFVNTHVPLSPSTSSTIDTSQRVVMLCGREGNHHATQTLVVYPPMGSTATEREMSTPPTLHTTGAWSTSPLHFIMQTVGLTGYMGLSGNRLLDYGANGLGLGLRLGIIKCRPNPFVCVASIVVKGELSEKQKKDIEKTRRNLRKHRQQVADLRQKLDSQTSLVDAQKARIVELTKEARLIQCTIC